MIRPFSAGLWLSWHDLARFRSNNTGLLGRPIEWMESGQRGRGSQKGPIKGGRPHMWMKRLGIVTVFPVYQERGHKVCRTDFKNLIKVTYSVWCGFRCSVFLLPLFFICWGLFMPKTFAVFISCLKGALKEQPRTYCITICQEEKWVRIKGTETF